METTPNGSALGRALILIYGLISYVVGVVGLVCIIAATGQLVSFGFLGYEATLSPLAMNLLLVAGWGAIHSVMARDSFKNLVTRLIPEAAERPTYVLVAGVTSVLLIGLWQPLAGVVWAAQTGAGTVALWALCAFGWVYLLAATFAINHFDLFGLRQVWLNFRGQPRPPVRFVKRAMYSFSRHPIQTGVLVGIWATPLMTTTQLVLSIGFTTYIFIGLWFEEKDLVKEIGAAYVAYRKETGLLLPRIMSRSERLPASRPVS